MQKFRRRKDVRTERRDLTQLWTRVTAREESVSSTIKYQYRHTELNFVFFKFRPYCELLKTRLDYFLGFFPLVVGTRY